MPACTPALPASTGPTVRFEPDGSAPSVSTESPLAAADTQPRRSTTSPGGSGRSVPSPVSSRTCVSAGPDTSRSSSTVRSASSRGTAGPGFSRVCAVVTAIPQSTGDRFPADFPVSSVELAAVLMPSTLPEVP